MSIWLQAAGVALAETRVPDTGGRRCAAQPDEDAVTLAAEAAAAALAAAPATWDPPDAVLLASHSLPYAEGGNAQLLVELLCLPPQTVVLELAATMRDGLAAVRVADGLLASGARGALVVGAHRARAGERGAGDGAVALLVRADAGLARLTPGRAHAEELRDRWRLAGDDTLRLADPSFADVFGAARVARLLAGERDGPEHVPVAVCGPAAAAAARAERELGGAGDALAPRTGVLGAAHPLLRLLDGLERATLVVAASGGVGDAVLCEPQPAAATLAAMVRENVASGTEADRAPVARAGPDFHPYQSAPRAWRERAQDLRLEGLRFGDRVHYPPPVVAPVGYEGESGVPVALARLGTVLTQTRDHVYPGGAVTQMVMLDLDDRTRFYGQVAAGSELEIGQRARLVPRRLHDGGSDPATGFIQYFWKARPCP
jgi:hypothetical protein